MRSLVPSCGGREDRILEKSVRTDISTNQKSFCNFRLIDVQVQVKSSKEIS
jgi:hypothetical protein